MPLVAGAGLSALVLGLAFFGQSWPDWPVGGHRPASDPPVVVGTIEDPVRPPATPEAAPAEPAPMVTQDAAASDEPDAMARPGMPVSSPPIPSAPEAAPAALALPALRAAPGSDWPTTSSASPITGDDVAPHLVALTDEPQSGVPTPDAAPSAAVSHWPPIPLLRPQELAASIAARQQALVAADPAAPESPVVVPASFEEQPSEEAAPPAGIQVVIKYTGASPEDAAIAQRLASFLQLRGFTVTDLRPVDHRIAQAGLRYFDRRDRELSMRLLEDVDWFFEVTPERAPDQLADFTGQRPKPPAGSVELWLPTS
jgi:hypothetical protein